MHILDKYTIRLGFKLTDRQNDPETYRPFLKDAAIAFYPSGNLQIVIIIEEGAPVSVEASSDRKLVWCTLLEDEVFRTSRIDA